MADVLLGGEDHGEIFFFLGKSFYIIENGLNYLEDSLPAISG